MRNRALWTCRHLIYGSFIGAYRARKGIGQPKSAATLDTEYRSGIWNYLEGLSEQPRHMVALGYIIGLSGSPRVLDVGCGTGMFLELGKHFSLSAYHGIDLSEAAILRARRRFRGQDTRFPIRFEVADLETYESEERYDVILFQESLPYVRDPVAVLNRYQSLLSPQGVFLISLCYNWWQNPLLERVTLTYRTRHSAEVINEEGLTWQIRVLERQRSDALRPFPEHAKLRRWTAWRSRLVEGSLMLRENIAAIIRGGPSLIVGFIVGVSSGKKSDDKA